MRFTEILEPAEGNSPRCSTFKTLKPSGSISTYDVDKRLAKILKPGRAIIHLFTTTKPSKTTLIGLIRSRLTLPPIPHSKKERKRTRDRREKKKKKKLPPLPNIGSHPNNRLASEERNHTSTHKKPKPKPKPKLKTQVP